MLFGISCTESESLNRFERKDFEHSKKLVEDKIKLPDQLSSPIVLKVIRDSILVVLNLPSEVEGFQFLELYNLNNKSLITKALPIGRGPQEWLSCVIEQANSEEVIVFDQITANAAIIDVDSLISDSSTYQPTKIKLPNFTGSIARYNDSLLIATDTRYLRSSKYHNKGISRLFKFPISGLSEELMLKFRQYNNYNFVSNISQAKIVCKENGVIFVADQTHDEIEQYNADLKLENVLKGPDDFEVEYFVQNNMVLTKQNHTSYYGVATSPEGFYCIYAGRNEIEEDFQSPVEVFKISWDGNLISRYELNVFAFDLSVGQRENQFYAVGFDPDEGVSFYALEM